MWRLLALLWLALVLLAALLAPVLPLPYPPGAPDLAHLAQAPFEAGGHWLGTDPQGRDVLSELIFGARTALLLTLPAALAAVAIGTVLGGAAGFWGNRLRAPVCYWLLALGAAWWLFALPGLLIGPGAVGLGALLWFRRRQGPTWAVPLDAAVLGAAAALDTLPRLVVVVALAAGAGGVSATSLLFLLAFTAWPRPARLVRAQMLRVRALPFIEAARAAGLSTWRTWAIHAIPHAIKPLRAYFPLSLAGLIGLENTLSFLGIGLPPDTASWGRLMATIRLEPGAWWAFASPAICLLCSMLSLNYFSKEPGRSSF